MNADSIFNLAFIVFISGIVGGRIFYILANLPYYLKNPLEIVMLQHGGLVWFGGMFGGLLGAFLYLRYKRLPFLKIMDLIVPFAALAHSLGRIGCLLNGCCYGWEVPWGLYFPVHQAILIPVQAFDSLVLLFMFIILRFLQERPHREGQVLYMYLIFYSISRFFIEFLRADSPRLLFHFTLFQFISIFVFFFSLFKLIFLLRSK